MFSMSTLALRLIISVGLISFSVAQSSECVLTSTTCQCSGSDSSGVCLKNQGDGSCLLGDCQDGHRCDCFGYELCSISSCSRYASNADTIPSETSPFQCHLKENAAQCISFTSVLETVAGAEYAQTEATISDEEASEATDDLSQKLLVVFNEKKVVREVLDELESNSEYLSEEEVESINELAAGVDKEAAEAAVLLEKTVTAASGCSRQKRETRALKKQTTTLQKQVDRAKIELRDEERKQRRENPSGRCRNCANIQSRITRLETNTRTAARKTCEKAQVARTSKRTCQGNNRRAVQVVTRARQAATECVRRARAAIGTAQARKARRS